MSQSTDARASFDTSGIAAMLSAAIYAAGDKLLQEACDPAETSRGDVLMRISASLADLGCAYAAAQRRKARVEWAMPTWRASYSLLAALADTEDFIDQLTGFNSVCELASDAEYIEHARELASVMILRDHADRTAKRQAKGESDARPH